MNTATYHDLGLELHALIARLEPARWKDEIRPELAAQLDLLRDKVDEAIREAAQDERLQDVLARLSELEAAMKTLPGPDDLRDRWMEFRLNLHPRYEALAEALKACHVELPSLRPTNYARSIVHAFFGLVAIAFVEFTPWWIIEIAVFGVTGFAWFLEVTRRYSERWNDLLMIFFGPIAHPHERYRVNSSTWYATALSLLALTGSEIACVAAVTALGFGDPAAALIGRKYGKTKLVNNRSLEGTLTFALVAFITILAVLLGFHPDLGLTTSLAIAGLAAFTSALAELFSRRVDDNFSIPVAAGASAWLILSLMA